MSKAPKSAKPALGIVKTPPRTAPALRASIPPQVRDAVSAFERQLGGRDALIEALSVADRSPEVADLLSLLCDPDLEHGPHGRTRSLVEVCHLSHLTPGDLFSAFKAAALARAQILGALTAANAADAVVKEIARVAVPHDETCGTCDGTGTVVPPKSKKNPNPEPERCAACRGTGTVRLPANPDAQQTILQMTELLKKSPGITTNVAVAAPPPASLGSLETLQQLLGEVLYAGRPAAQAETPPIVEGETIAPPLSDTPA